MNKDFWICALIRAIRTICQTAIAMIGTAVFLSDVNWVGVASASVLSGILSIMTSIATGLPEVSYAESLYALENNPNEDVDDFDDEEYEDGDE